MATIETVSICPSNHVSAIPGPAPIELLDDLALPSSSQDAAWLGWFGA
jgi:hypothetical protein